MTADPLTYAEMNELGSVLMKYLEDTKWRERANAETRRRDDPFDVVLSRRALCRRIIREGLWGNG